MEMGCHRETSSLIVSGVRKKKPSSSSHEETYRSRAQSIAEPAN
jgi:hypothetical protein